METAKLKKQTNKTKTFQTWLKGFSDEVVFFFLRRISIEVLHMAKVSRYHFLLLHVTRWHVILWAPLHSIKTPANYNCTLLKHEEYQLYFVKSCHGNAATDSSLTPYWLI